MAMSAPDHPQPPAKALLRPLARLLRPLVRLLIRRGLTFPVVSDLLRTLYVQVATEQLPAAARTDSRVSLMTGVHRKEIRRLREQAGDEPDVPAVVTLGSQIVARWLGLPAYAGPDGRPRPLRRGGAGEGPSFEGLVGSVTTDLRARAVLDDWLSQELVSLDADGRVVLNQAAFLPRPGSEAQLFYFARNLHDHIAAASANLTEAGPAFLDRSVHYDRLPLSVAGRLEDVARDAAQHLLLEVNRQALELLEQGGEAETGQPTRRVNLGIYLFAEDEPGRTGA